jgi:hypothetical protein
MGFGYIEFWFQNDGIVARQSTKSEQRWMENSTHARQCCQICKMSPSRNTGELVWMTQLQLAIHLWQGHKGLTLHHYWILLAPDVVELD